MVDECERSLDSAAQESVKVHGALCDTVAWLGRIQDGLASLDPVSCDRDRLMLQCRDCEVVHTHTPVYTHPFNDPFSGSTQVSRYQKGKTNLDFNEARDSEWQWHQLDHMQVCTSLQTNNRASTPPLSFLQAGCPSCRLANSVKALKALK